MAAAVAATVNPATPAAAARAPRTPKNKSSPRPRTATFTQEETQQSQWRDKQRESFRHRLSANMPIFLPENIRELEYVAQRNHEDLIYSDRYTEDAVWRAEWERQRSAVYEAEQLIKILTNSTADPAKRERAGFALAQVDSSGWERRAVDAHTDALAELCSQEGADALARHAAVVALAAHTTSVLERHAGLLVWLLDDEDERVGAVAAGAVARCDPYTLAAHSELIVRHLHHPSERVRRLAIEALRRLDARQFGSHIAEELSSVCLNEDEAPDLRYAVRAMLGRMHGPPRVHGSSRLSSMSMSSGHMHMSGRPKKDGSWWGMLERDRPDAYDRHAAHARYYRERPIGLIEEFPPRIL